MGAPKNSRKPTIAGVIRNRIFKSAQSWPQTIDEAEQKHGLKVYDEMEQTNVEIATSLAYLQDRVFEDGPQFLPNKAAPLPGADPNSPESLEYAESLKCAAFVQTVFKELANNGYDPEILLRQAFSAAKYGRSVSEMTFDYMEGAWKGWIGLSAFRFIPRENYVLVFDPYAKFLGVLGIEPGKGYPLHAGPLPDVNAFGNFVPAERLFFQVLKPSDQHPAGQSLLRSCYRSWWSMRQVEPLEYGSMAQWGMEGMILIAGEGAFQNRKVTDPTTRVTEDVNEIEFTLRMMEGWSPDQVTVLPTGTTRLNSDAKGNAEGFAKFFDRHGRRLVFRILYSATMLYEAERNSQAQAGKAENITDTAVRALRQTVSRQLRQQVVRKLIEVNKGKEYADRYSPIVAMAQMAAPDRVELLKALASAMQAGVVTEAMLPEIWRKWLGADYLPNKEPKEPKDKNDEPNQ